MKDTEKTVADKEQYLKPSMEIVKLNAENAIVTSERCGSGDPNDNEGSMANIF